MLFDDLDFDDGDDGYDIIEMMELDDVVRTSEEPSGNVGCLAFVGFFLLVGEWLL